VCWSRWPRPGCAPPPDRRQCPRRQENGSAGRIRGSERKKAPRPNPRPTKVSQSSPAAAGWSGPSWVSPMPGRARRGAGHRPGDASWSHPPRWPRGPGGHAWPQVSEWPSSQLSRLVTGVHPEVAGVRCVDAPDGRCPRCPHGGAAGCRVVNHALAGWRAAVPQSALLQATVAVWPGVWSLSGGCSAGAVITHRHDPNRTAGRLGPSGLLIPSPHKPVRRCTEPAPCSAHLMARPRPRDDAGRVAKCGCAP
jgi:hypothetical protein